MVYLFCEYGDHERFSPRNVIGSIAYQLAMQQSTPAQELYPGGACSKRLENIYSVEQCRTLLAALMEIFPSVTLVIDALDECPEATTDFLLEELNTYRPKMRILVTTRFLYARRFSERDLKMEIRADKRDIHAYVRERIMEPVGEELRLQKKWSCDKPFNCFLKNVMKKVSSRADGI